MRLDQGKELHAAPELRPVIRSAEGQRLDDARAEFRAEWQAKVDRKRQQAKRAMRVAIAIKWAAGGITFGGIMIGVFLGAKTAATAGYLVSQGMVVVICAAVASLFAMLPILLALLCSWIFRSHAERLEREATELERS